MAHCKNVDIISKWGIFADIPLSSLLEYSNVHIFKNGNAAFLSKAGKLYCIGECAINTCLMDITSINSVGGQCYKPAELRKLNANGIKAIATGYDHVALVDNDGVVFCWGSNDKGQLGNGVIEKSPPIISSLNIVNVPRIEQISCGENYTIALSRTNELWLWGSVKVGFYDGLPTKVQLPDNTKITQISAGSNHVAVLTITGKVITFGENCSGQLVRGHISFQLGYPEYIVSPLKFRYVLCGRNFTMFITESGNLYSSVLNSPSSKTNLKPIKTREEVAKLALTRNNDHYCAEDKSGRICRGIVLSGDLKDGNSETICTVTNQQHILESFINLNLPSIVPASWNSCQDMVSLLKNPVFSPVPNLNLDSNISVNFNESVNEEAATNKKVTKQGRLKTANTKVSELSKDFLSLKFSYKFTPVESSLFNMEFCSDIKIILSDGILHVHKFILAANSAYLKKLINDLWKDRKEVDMTNMDANAYKSYIKFLYTGNLDGLSIHQIPEVYSLGDKDDNKTLKKLCLEMWKNELNLDNICSSFYVAYLYKCQELVNACCPIISEHFDKIKTSKEYLVELPHRIKKAMNEGYCSVVTNRRLKLLNSFVYIHNIK